MMNADQPTSTRIQSVGRAARVLEFVALRGGEGLRATELATALGTPLPTLHHLVSTLVDEGLLSKSSDRRYQLGPKVGLLAEAFAAQNSAPEHLLARLRELAEHTGETTYLSVWRGSDAVLISIVEGHRAVRVAGLHLGYAGNAHLRASGKVLLAFGRPGTLAEYLRRQIRSRSATIDARALEAELAEIRSAGYAVDDEAFAEGVACLAVPVADGSMSIGISVPAERFRSARAELVTAVLAVAAPTAVASLRSVSA
jgi:DNA-binding IclR family transcriptional regulator